MLGCCYDQMMRRKLALEREALQKDSHVEQMEQFVKSLLGMLLKVRDSIEEQMAGQSETIDSEAESACGPGFNPIPNRNLVKMVATLMVIWAFFFFRSFWTSES